MAFSLTKPFTDEISSGVFVPVHKYAGEQYTIFMPCQRVGELVFDDVKVLNGRCKYCFVMLGTIIVGVLLITPVADTRVTGFYMTVADPVSSHEETFVRDTVFEPQGILLLKGNASSIIVINKDAHSPLLVEVN